MSFSKFKQLLLTSHNVGLCFIWWKVANIQDGKRICTKIEQFSRGTPTSLDSEAYKKPIAFTATCSEQHEGRQVLHTVIPINIDTLYKLLFSKSKFMDDFHRTRESTNIIYGDWNTNEEGQRMRTVNRTVKIDIKFGPNTSKVTEKQIIRNCSKPGELYSIDIESVNADIPYADSFKVWFHYCMVRTADDQTLLSVYARINFTKQIFNIIKTLIERNTWSNLGDFFQALLYSLQRELNIMPVKEEVLKKPEGHRLEKRVLAIEEN